MKMRIPANYKPTTPDVCRAEDYAHDLLEQIPQLARQAIENINTLKSICFNVGRPDLFMQISRMKADLMAIKEWGEKQTGICMYYDGKDRVTVTIDGRDLSVTFEGRMEV